MSLVREVRSHSRQGGDDLDVGLQRIVAELEADLVVALAGGAVGDGVGTHQLGDLDLALGDQRPGDRGAEQVLALVERVGAEHREHEIAHEFFAEIVDEDLLHAHHLGLLARRLQLFALADVGGEGHHLALVGVLQPTEDDRGVEAAGIGQNDLLDAAAHNGSREDYVTKGIERPGSIGGKPWRGQGARGWGLGLRLQQDADGYRYGRSARSRSSCIRLQA